MPSLEQRLDALEKRTKAAEDELAIIRLVASYGPMVDCGSVDLAPSLFAPEGVYDVSYGRMTGPDAIASLLRGAEHQAILTAGIAHVMGLPWVRVDGDEAVAVNSTQLFVRDGDGFATFRVAHNVWKLQRTENGGWVVMERINRLIGKDGEARDLLRAHVDCG